MSEMTPSSTNTAEDSSPVFFKNVIRLGVYLIFSLGVFFFLAVIVFSIRTREKEKVIMPDVTGKYYIDAHNDLSKARLRINITKMRLEDLPPGMVVHQSIQPGSTFHPGDSLELTVNQPEPLVRMPDLVGSSLQASETVLSRINYDDEVYNLEIGAVTHIPIDGVPPDTVLAQFPPVGEMITVQDKVFVLVSARVSKVRQPEVSVESLKGQNIAILNEYFIRNGDQYKIVEVKEPESPNQNGHVANIKKVGDKSYSVSVYLNKPRVRYRSGFELLEIEMEGKGVCKVSETHEPLFGDANEESQTRDIYRLKHDGSDAPVRVVYFRRGVSHVKAECGEEQVFNKDISPDDFG